MQIVITTNQIGKVQNISFEIKADENQTVLMADVLTVLTLAENSIKEKVVKYCHGIENDKELQAILHSLEIKDLL